LAGVLGVRAGHERGELLVWRLDELGLIPRALNATDDPVDAVTGIAEDARHPPRPKAGGDKVSNFLCCLLFGHATHS